MDKLPTAYKLQKKFKLKAEASTMNMMRKRGL
jgi:hypothetical protein